IALRADSLPTRSRMARGNNGNRQCRHHCNAFETSNHAIQRCHATHGLRVKRHDKLVAMVASRLKERGYRVDVEPRFRTPVGTRVPDIVAYNEHEAIVVDCQVVGTIMSTELAEQTKVNYYA